MNCRHWLVCLIVPVFLITPFVPNSRPQEKKKALMVWGGAEMHEPRQCVEVFAPLLEAEGFEVEISPNLDPYANAEKMKSLTLIVQSVTTGNISSEQERGLLEAVRNGVGLAGWHAGLADSFRGHTRYEFMVGGIWVAHPGNVFDYDVNIVHPTDPITRGLTDFKIRSEQYYFLVDPNTEVLATTTFPGKPDAPWTKDVVMPAAWKKMYGKGRVFFLSVGHSVADFEVPQAREIMKRGMLWAARVPGMGDDAKSTNPYQSR